MTKIALYAAATLVIGAVTAAPAQATTFIDLTNPILTIGGTSTGNKLQYKTILDGEELNLQVTGWNITTNVNPKVRDAKVIPYSGGLGVTASGDGTVSPGHAIDNEHGYNFLLFQFDRAVQIDSFDIGWFYKDTDATVRWGDVNALWNSYPNQNPDINDKNVSVLYNLLPNSIDVLGGASIGPRDLGLPEDTTANWWMISALNPVELIQSCTKSGSKSKCSSAPGYDYFKISSIGVSVPLTVVPEPATWMLMIGGLGLAGGVLRRRNRISGRFQAAAA